jgi:hypothetical protein
MTSNRWIAIFLTGALTLLGIFAFSRTQMVRAQIAGLQTATPSITYTVTDTPENSATATFSSTLEASQSATLMPSATATPSATIEGSLAAVIPLIMHEPTPVGYGPDAFPFDVNPLTGLPVADTTLLNRRPLVVKVTNYPRTVRPQSGLSRADIVYEYYMERGIPRFVAIFYGNDVERVGPVRSGRFFDAHVFQMYDGFFIFGYADERIFDFFETLGEYWLHSFILDAGLVDIDCNAEQPRFLCRDAELITYNNLFANTAMLTRVGDGRELNHRVDLNGMRFTRQTPAEGELALDIRVRYSLFIYHKWTYNVTLGRYQRFQETIGDANPNFEQYAAHMDALTGEQLAADNVVVLLAPHYYFVKTATTEITNIPLYGEGPAYVFRDGYVFAAKWYRPTLDQGVLQILTIDDEPFSLKPGSTWFQVMSTKTAVTRSDWIWRFVFVPPEEGGEAINPNGENAPYGIYEEEIFEIMGVTATPEGE